MCDQGKNREQGRRVDFIGKSAKWQQLWSESRHTKFKTSYLNPVAVVAKLYYASESLGGLLQHRLQVPHPTPGVLIKSIVDLSLCISNKFSGDIDATGLEITF